MDQLELLRLFVGIAEQGSLSAAARARGLAPATVTAGLQRLEDRLGARLAIRTTRRLSLTPEGERFVADCRRILADVDETMNGIADRGPLRGEIRLTATNDFGRTRLAPLIDDFMRRHPDVSVSLLLTDAVIDLAEEGYDFGIRAGVPADSRLAAHLLLPGRRHVCAAPHYWTRAGQPSHPQDLTRHNCLILARPGAPQTSWAFAEHGRPFHVRVRGDRSVNDGGTLRRWAIAGAGVVLKSSFDIAEDLAAGRLQTVLDAFTNDEVSLYAVHPQRTKPSRRAQALIGHLHMSLAATG